MLLAGLAGLVAGAVVAPFLPWQAGALIGWDAAASVFMVWVWWQIGPLDAAATRALARREDTGAAVSDLVVLGAGLACLVGIGLALLRAGHAHGGAKAALIALGVLSVVLSWASVHTVYTLRYARLFYGDTPGAGVDFHDPTPPTYHDFAYLSFTVGMTFQVSDPEITHRVMRGMVLRHGLLSFVFGAVIVGLTINVVATLLQ